MTKPTATKLRTYRALSHAAERIGWNGYVNAVNAAGLTFAQAERRQMRTKRGLYAPTEAHRDVLEAMPLVLSGELSANDAMALLHRGDVLNERTGTK